MTRHNYGADANDIFSQMINKALARSDQDVSRLQGVDPAAIKAYYNLQNQYNQSFPINSAGRSPEQNAAVGGVPASQHLAAQGNTALDFDISRLSPEQRANLPANMQQAGFTGIGQYPGQNFAHGDTRTQTANWGGAPPEGSRSNVATNLMAAQEPNSLMNQTTGAASQSAAPQGQTLDYSTILNELNASQPEARSQGWADALAVLSKGLGDMGAGRAVDVSGQLARQAKQRAGRQAITAKNQAAAGLAVTLSKMKGGMPYAQMLSMGGDPKTVMPLYMQNNSHLFEGGQAELVRAFQGLQNEATRDVTRRGQDLTADTAAAGQGVTMRGQNIGARTALAGQDVTMRGQNITAETTLAGQDLAAATALAGQGITKTGQDLAAATALAGQGVTMRGQNITAETAAAGFESRELVADADRTSRELGYLTAARTAAANRGNAAEIAALNRANTTELSEYAKYVEQGGTDAFTPWDRKNKLASVQPLPNIEKRLAMENRIARGNAYLTNKQDKYLGAQTIAPKLAELDLLLREGATTGTFSDWTKTFARAARDLGVLSEDQADQVSRGESFEAVVNSYYTMMTEALKGAVTDREGAIAASGAPQFLKATEVNEYLIDMMQTGLARQNAELSFLDTQVTGQGISPYVAQSEWNEKVKRGDPETYPLFVDISKGGWTRENLINDAANWIPGKTVIYKGRTPIRVTDKIKDIYVNGRF